MSPVFIVVDLFCGAGGTTTGFELAQMNGSGVAKVIACVNHDHKAIRSHWMNHPGVKHFEEDMRTLDLKDLVSVVDQAKAKYPSAFLILWASLECTNFSRAKGGQPRDGDSRTLADYLDRYIIAIDPDYVQIENVTEFMSWGPLDQNGKPISKKNGSEWLRWRGLINALGYVDQWRELNSANFGAYTSRNRLFGVFARTGLPIAWPTPTHAKIPSKLSMHGDLQKWKAVKEVLNFDDRGESIFNRKIPLVEKTLARIYAGLIKFVAKGDRTFITKYYSGKPMGKNISIDGPAGTITTIDGQSLVRTEFLAAHYSTGENVSSVESPCPTISTKDRFQVIKAEYFLDKHFGASQNQSVDQPAGTIMPNDKHRLVESVPFIMPTNYENSPTSVDEPVGTITANRKWSYLVNPSWGGHPTSTDVPCPVIVARQDKAPLYLIESEVGAMVVPVYDTDSETMINIKKFMSVYGIGDIKMRMLRVHELLRIQGFPSGYQLDGSQADQKKFIGNSVVPHVVKEWAQAMADRLSYSKSQSVA